VPVLSKKEERQALTLTLSDKIKKRLRADSDIDEMEDAMPFESHTARNGPLHSGTMQRPLHTNRPQIPNLGSRFKLLPSPSGIRSGSGKIPQFKCTLGNSAGESRGSSLETYD
jgi:hypothetical protein